MYFDTIFKNSLKKKQSVKVTSSNRGSKAEFPSDTLPVSAYTHSVMWSSPQKNPNPKPKPNQTKTKQKQRILL